MPQLPSFANEQEAAEWFATHDTAPYMDDLKEETEPIPVTRSPTKKKPIELRPPSDYTDKKDTTKH